MKKAIKNILVFSAAAIMAFGAAACGATNTGSDSTTEPSSGQQGGGTAYTAETEHFAKGTLHEKNVKENESRIFVQQQKSDYKIIVEDNAHAKTAADFLKKQIKAATGCELKSEIYLIGMEDEWTSEDKYIVLNCVDLFEAAELEMPDKDLGASGYYLKTVGNTVFIMSPDRYGYQMGAISFLEQTLGYDMYFEDCVSFDKTGETIPDMEIIEKPDYDYREPSNKSAFNYYYGQGFNISYLNQMYIPVRENVAEGEVATRRAESVHNAYNFLPPERFFASHPKWFYDPYNRSAQQLCYTAHGDEEEYRLMVEEVARWMIVNIDENPEHDAITLTHLDNAAACTCEACKAAVKKYGAISSTIIMFLNDVDDIVQNYLKEQAELNGTKQRKMIILFFAYHATKDSPTVRDSNGEFHPTYDEVVMNKNVGVFVAPIESYYSHSFYEDINLDYGEANNLISWGCLTDNLYLWLYETHFSNYFHPYNSWDSVVETYRFGLENNAVFVWNEGQHNQTSPTCFSILKQYTDAKALIDVNVNYADIEEKFFRNYFGSAYEPMYTFFKELESHLEYVEDNFSAVSGRLNADMAKKEYFGPKLIDHWLELIDDAYAAIEKYRSVDPATYEMLRRHILIESLFPRYFKLMLYPYNYSNDELQAERKAFADDNNYVGNSQERESGGLNMLFASWGF